MLREQDAKHRSLALLAVHEHASADPADNPVHGGKSESGALPQPFRRKEWLEHASEHVRRHAVAVVPEPDLDVITHGHAASRAPATGAHVLADRADRDEAALRHRVACVDGEVDEHLRELAAIHEHVRQVGGHARLESHALADQPLQQSVDVAHHAAHVERLGAGDLLSAEGKQLVGHDRGVLGGAKDLLHVQPDGGDILALAARLRKIVRAVEREAAEPDDRGEDVVEVVRDAARECSHSLHLLRVQKLLLLPAQRRFGLEPDLHLATKLRVGELQFPRPLLHGSGEAGLPLDDEIDQSREEENDREARGANRQQRGGDGRVPSADRRRHQREVSVRRHDADLHGIGRHRRPR